MIRYQFNILIRKLPNGWNRRRVTNVEYYYNSITNVTTYNFADVSKDLQVDSVQNGENYSVNQIETFVSPTKEIEKVANFIQKLTLPILPSIIDEEKIRNELAFTWDNHWTEINDAYNTLRYTSDNHIKAKYVRVSHH